MGYIFFRRKNGKEIIIYVLKKCPMLSMKLLIHLDCHVVYARRVSAGTALADADVGVTVNERLLGHTSDESKQIYQKASVNTR